MTTPRTGTCPRGPRREHGPQVALNGLRTDSPILRADLSLAASTFAKGVQQVYAAPVKLHVSPVTSVPPHLRSKMNARRYSHLPHANHQKMTIQ